MGRDIPGRAGGRGLILPEEVGFWFEKDPGSRGKVTGPSGGIFWITNGTGRGFLRRRGIMSLRMPERT